MNGKSGETGLLDELPSEGPLVVWRARIGTGFSSISVVDGKAYTMGFVDGEDVLYALDAETGEELWTYTYPSVIFDKQHEGGPATTPVYSDGRLYILSRMGIVHCIDAESGKKIWAHDTRDLVGAEVPIWGFSGCFYIDGDHALVDVGIIIAFDAESGDVIWQTDNYGAAYSTPKPMEFGGKRVIAAFPAYGLVLLEPETGEEISKFAWPTKYQVNACYPLQNGNQVFLSSEYGQGSAMVNVADDLSLSSAWETKDFSNHFNGSIWLDGYLYGYTGHYGRSDGDFRCVDAETGEVIWTEPSVSRGSVLLAEGRLIILTGLGELVLADPSPEGFKEISRAQVVGGKCWTEPALSDGKLYLRNAQGILVCLDLTAG